AVVGFAAGSDLVVYELPSGKERLRIKTATHWYGEMAFGPGAKVLAAFEGDPRAKEARIRLFETETGRPVGEISAGETFSGLAFSADGTRLLANNYGQDLTVWEVPSGRVLHRVKANVNATVKAAFDPAGRSIVVGTQSPDTVRIDLETGKELRR